VGLSCPRAWAYR